MKDKQLDEIVEAVNAFRKNINEFCAYFQVEEIDENMEIKKEGVITNWLIFKRLFRNKPSLMVDKETKMFLQELRDDKSSVIENLRGIKPREFINPELFDKLFDVDAKMTEEEIDIFLSQSRKESLYNIKKEFDAKFTELQMEDTGDETLYGGLLIAGFNSSLMKVGPIFLNEKNEAKKFINLYEKIRVCFAKEEYEAAIIFCRALLEEALWNIYSEKTGTKKKTRKLMLTILMEAKNLNLNAELKEKIELVRDAADNLLHSGAFTDITIGRSIALEQIKNTITVLEELF